ncbi:hypothetical protein ABTZ03_08385 [Kitasatospora sp. NPDC096077]|uniref:hypothetical protein n=1 Tax=Kitasatospora sp. NPDC096077 TaxID=3155544 RepID=UPI0033311D2B
MQLVRIERTATGFALDPRPYLARLPALRPELPPGAEAFATDPAHYDFASERCVKDLKLASLVVTEDAVVLRCSFNDVAPEQLVIRYTGVTALLIEAAPPTGAGGPTGPDGQDGLRERLGPLQLDEVLPHPHGCTHELGHIGGTVRITAGDLTATWLPRPPA